MSVFISVASKYGRVLVVPCSLLSLSSLTPVSIIPDQINILWQNRFKSSFQLNVEQLKLTSSPDIADLQLKLKQEQELLWSHINFS